MELTELMAMSVPKKLTTLKIRKLLRQAGKESPSTRLQGVVRISLVSRHLSFGSDIRSLLITLIGRVDPSDIPRLNLGTSIFEFVENPDPQPTLEIDQYCKVRLHEFNICFEQADRSLKLLWSASLQNIPKVKLVLNLKRRRLGFCFNVEDRRVLVESQLCDLKAKGCKVSIRRDSNVELSLPFMIPSRCYFIDPADSNKCKGEWSVLDKDDRYKRCPNLFELSNKLLIYLLQAPIYHCTMSRQDFHELLPRLEQITEVTRSRVVMLRLEARVRPVDIDRSSLPFSTKYMLYCLLSHCFLTAASLSRGFIVMLQSLVAEGKAEQVDSALHRLFSYCQSIGVQDFQDYPSLFTRYMQTRTLPCMERANYNLMRKALVTPLMIKFLPPELEVSNRVTRHFRGHVDDFLRVVLAEGDSSRVNEFTASIKQRLKGVLSGLVIAGRTFKFLAYSSSQLRDHGFFMFADNHKVNCDLIRSWLGDFSSIKSPAKFGARLGLCLASSENAGVITADQLKEIPDVERDGYCFSDGCGVISESLLRKITPRPEVTAVQFRLGGIKGTVSLARDSTGEFLHFRPSMKKFEARCLDFEKLSLAEFRHGYLNRQFITLMESRGVAAQIFVDLQEVMMAKYHRIFSEPALACEVLKTHNTDDVQSFMIERAIQLIQAGVDLKEPYIQGTLKAAYARAMASLKNKQRILVTNSACLMGVMDESASLEYGQVFCQLRTDEETSVVMGKVLVSKNPCVHPGDLRVLDAVACPQLDHLYNLVIFPSKGPRPHSNEISGSDLDGDLYFITWEPGLIPPGDYAPMDYSSVSQVQDSPVTISQVIDFIVEFFEKNNLGSVANTHVAIADRSPDGALSKKCLELSSMHSAAVDYPKTGIPVKIDYSLKPKTWPDFMEKKDAKSYKSRKAIGTLYRSVDENHTVVLDAAPTLVFKSNEYPSEILAEAQTMLKMYRSQILASMKSLGIDSEVSYLTGEVTQVSKLYERRNNFIPEIRLKVKLELEELEKNLRRSFAGRPKGSVSSLAAACYELVRDCPDAIAFPWLVAFQELYSHHVTTQRESCKRD